MTFFDNFRSLQLIAAHRGFRANYPENTLAAFKASIGRCHFIELDVQLSKDLVPMVIHDPTLLRTSDAEMKMEKLGLESLEVKQWNLLQLKSLDVGSWFLHADPFGTLAGGRSAADYQSNYLPQTLLTLEELLRSPSLARTPMNIEIKDHRGWAHNHKVTERVLQVIHKTKSQQRVLISSFNHDYLVIAKTCAPNITTAALQAGSHPENPIEYLHSIGVAAYHPSDDITSAELVRKLRAAGIGVNVYTVNDRVRQRELFSYGVTAIFTDFPELAGG